MKLRWAVGTFVLDDGKPSTGAALVANNADKVFLKMLSAINRSGARVSVTTGTNYAPSIMAKRPDREGASKKALEYAMHRAIADGTVVTVWEGSPSKKRQRLVVVEDEVKQGRAGSLPPGASTSLPPAATGLPPAGATTPLIPPVAVEGRHPVESTGRCQPHASNDNVAPSNQEAA